MTTGSDKLIGVIAHQGAGSLSSMLMLALERELMRPTSPVVITLRDMPTEREPFSLLPYTDPRPPETKATEKNLHVGKFGAMPIPAGKRKKFKKRNRK